MRLRPALAFGLLVLGAVLMGQGLWIQAKAELAQVLLQHAWNKTLADGQPHKPWPWADHWPVAEIMFERQQQRHIVLEGDSGAVLAFAPGHNPLSGLPGNELTSIISGHRDTHFRVLQNIQADDVVQLGSLGGSHRYRVLSRQVIDSRQQRLALMPDQGLKLVTCWPFNALRSGGPLRLVVDAKLIEQIESPRTF